MTNLSYFLKQVKALGKFFSFSFLWGFFQWFFRATDSCGFSQFPTFGLKAFDNSYFFDFSATYVGVGMICPHIINVSVLVGAILSWGIMWPLINTKKGVWYSPELESKSLHGLFRKSQPADFRSEQMIEKTEIAASKGWKN